MPLGLLLRNFSRKTKKRKSWLKKNVFSSRTSVSFLPQNVKLSSSWLNDITNYNQNFYIDFFHFLWYTKNYRRKILWKVYSLAKIVIVWCSHAQQKTMDAVLNVDTNFIRTAITERQFQTHSTTDFKAKFILPLLGRKTNKHFQHTQKRHIWPCRSFINLQRASPTAKAAYAAELYASRERFGV